MIGRFIHIETVGATRHIDESSCQEEGHLPNSVHNTFDSKSDVFFTCGLISRHRSGIIVAARRDSLGKRTGLCQTAAKP